MRICLECADGGHLDEMMALEDAFLGHELCFVTFDTRTTAFLRTKGITRFVPNFKGVIDPTGMPSLFRNVYTVLYLARNVLRCFFILRNDKPEVVISTGGPVTIPLFFLTKIFRIKSIYIESITRVHGLSGTGRIVCSLADIFLVQWQTLLVQCRHAEYWGKVI